LARRGEPLYMFHGEDLLESQDLKRVHAPAGEDKG
jgi:hypothetical protein